MYRLIPVLVLFIGLSVFQSCKGPKEGKIDLTKTYRVGFYNVENLFDTLDQVDKFDEDFTPTGKQMWNTERYTKKLADLDKVIAGMAYPILLGLCEVENELVLKDLASKNGMSKKNYGIVHYESPDKRGIDCALLYQKDYFEVEASDKIRVVFPKDIADGYTSRDIIYAKGKLFKTHTLHIFVNHWPSRRGGLAASEPKRMLVGGTFKKSS